MLTNLLKQKRYWWLCFCIRSLNDDLYFKLYRIKETVLEQYNKQQHSYFLIKLLFLNFCTRRVIYISIYIYLMYKILINEFMKSIYETADYVLQVFLLKYGIFGGYNN